MPVKTLMKNGNRVWIRHGAPSFYAVASTDTIKTIVEIRYSDKTVFRNQPIIEPLDDLRFNGLGQEIRNPLSAFLLTLYRRGFDLTNPDIFHNLDQDIEAADILDQYENIKLIELLIIAGVKKRMYKKEDGTVIDLRKWNMSNPFPALVEIPNDATKNRLITLIKHLGLKNLIISLFIEEIIHFDEFKELLEFFIPDQEGKREFYKDRLRPSLRSKNHPLFSREELNALGII